MLQHNWRPSLPATGSIANDSIALGRCVFGRCVFGRKGLMLAASALASAMMAISAPATAETLQEALASAYTYNPTLEAGRSGLRAVDESVSIANAGYRPVISGGGTLSWENTTLAGNGANNVVGTTGNITQGGINRSAGYGVGITQPIFTGFQTTYGVRGAEADVRSARELLRDTERSILMQAVSAYVAVLSAQEGVKAFEESLNRLNKEVGIAKERVSLTELTVTDLSQAELRRTNAMTSRTAAIADLKSARAAYLNAVGHEPSGLRFPKVPAGLPKSVAEAQAIALQENPLIISSLYTEESARHAVDKIRGQLLPQASIEAGWGDEYNSSGVSFQRSTVVQGRLDIPLYDGGRTHAAVRQAKQIHLSRIQTIGATRGLVQQAVSRAWSQLEAARARVELGNARIRSSETALKGVRSEEAIGQRSLLDVLNAEQDILDARLSLILARRDVVVGSYEVLSQLGRLSVEQLGVATLMYDPAVHYEEVRRKWFGLDITHADGEHQHVVVQDTTADRAPTK